jgi:hypothetical protein
MGHFLNIAFDKLLDILNPHSEILGDVLVEGFVRVVF